MRRHSQEAGQSPRKRRFQDAEFEQGEEEVVSRSHSDEVDTPGDVVLPSEEGEQNRDGETTQPPKKHSSKLSLLASQVDRQRSLLPRYTNGRRLRRESRAVQGT